MKLRERFKSKEEFESILGAAEGFAKSDFAVGFVKSIREKYNQFGMSAFLSDKQVDVLKKISVNEPKKK